MESQLITAQFLKATPRTGCFFCFWALNPSRRDLGKLHPALFCGFLHSVSSILVTKIYQFIRLIPSLPQPFGFGESSTNHCGQKWSTHAATHPTQVLGLLGGSSPLLLYFGHLQGLFRSIYNCILSLFCRLSWEGYEVRHDWRMGSQWMVPWLGSPPCISDGVRPFGRGPPRCPILTMSQLTTEMSPEMILQAGCRKL